MNLIFFLMIGVIFSLVLGEFGQIPFGSPNSVSVMDVLVSLTVGFLLIWKIGIKKQLFTPMAQRLFVGWCLVALLSLVLSGVWGGILFWVRLVIYSSLIWVGYELIISRVVSLKRMVDLIIAAGLSLMITGIVQLIWWPISKKLDQCQSPVTAKVTNIFCAYVPPIETNTRFLPYSKLVP